MAFRHLPPSLLEKESGIEPSGVPAGARGESRASGNLGAAVFPRDEAGAPAFRPPLRKRFWFRREKEGPDRFFRESRRRPAPGPSFRGKKKYEKGRQPFRPAEGLGGQKKIRKPLAYFGNLV
jgi:hypothetical protein